MVCWSLLSTAKTGLRVHFAFSSCRAVLGCCVDTTPRPPRTPRQGDLWLGAQGFAEQRWAALGSLAASLLNQRDYGTQRARSLGRPLFPGKATGLLEKYIFSDFKTPFSDFKTPSSRARTGLLEICIFSASVFHLSMGSYGDPASLPSFKPPAPTAQPPPCSSSEYLTSDFGHAALGPQPPTPSIQAPACKLRSPQPTAPTIAHGFIARAAYKEAAVNH